MIEINLNKLIGTHEENIQVTRDGKTFWRKQRVGKKDVLDEFKLSLKDMNDDTLKSQIAIIEKDYPGVREGLDNWYTNKSMATFDGQLSSLFEMNQEKSRSKEKVDLDLNTAEGYKKIYLITQEYLSRTDDDNTITVHRGLGPRSYQRYKDLESGEDIDIEQYNVSSWTNDYDMASEFAQIDKDGGVSIEAIISTKRIFMHPDCASDLSEEYGEGEVIIMGHSIDAVVSDVFHPDSEEEDDYE